MHFHGAVAPRKQVQGFGIAPPHVHLGDVPHSVLDGDRRPERRERAVRRYPGKGVAVQHVGPVQTGRAPDIHHAGVGRKPAHLCEAGAEILRPVQHPHRPPRILEVPFVPHGVDHRFRPVGHNGPGKPSPALYLVQSGGLMPACAVIVGVGRVGAVNGDNAEPFVAPVDAQHPHAAEPVVVVQRGPPFPLQRAAPYLPAVRRNVDSAPRVVYIGRQRPPCLVVASPLAPVSPQRSGDVHPRIPRKQRSSLPFPFPHFPLGAAGLLVQHADVHPRFGAVHSFQPPFPFFLEPFLVFAAQGRIVQDLPLRMQKSRERKKEEKEGKKKSKRVPGLHESE